MFVMGFRRIHYGLSLKIHCIHGGIPRQINSCSWWDSKRKSNRVDSEGESNNVCTGISRENPFYGSS